MQAPRLRFLLSFCVLLLAVATFTKPAHAQVALQSGQTDMGTVAVGSPVATTLTFTFSAGVTMTTPTVVTQGSGTMDFTSAGGTCTAGAYAAGQTCTIVVQFLPIYPGLRMGAVLLTDSAGNMTTTYLHGIGSGAPPVTTPPFGVMSFSYAPRGLAVDAGGYLYVGNASNYDRTGYVVQINETTQGSTQAVRQLYNPNSIAVDGAGAVYVADYGTFDAGGCDCVWKSFRGAQSMVSFSGSVSPRAVVVDGAGNLYVADVNSQSVLKIAPDGTQSTAATGFSHIGTIAIDASGNLYVADSNIFSGVFGGMPVEWDYEYVRQVYPGGVKTTVWAGISGGGVLRSNAASISVDADGTLYVVDSFENVWRVTPGQYQQRLHMEALAPYRPSRMVLDSNGIAYFSDIANKAVVPLAAIASVEAYVDGICGAADGGISPTKPKADLCCPPSAEMGLVRLGS